MSQETNDLIIKEILKANPKSVDELSDLKRLLSKKYNLDMPSNAEFLVLAEKNPDLAILRKMLRKRAVRTLSGVAPVAVLTKPWPCPGKCAYCPTEKDVPQSYLSNEPAVMRAIHCDYNPYEQVAYRLRALENNGHEPTKIELIVIGGTWSYLPDKYQYWYLINCFAAANQYQFKNKKPKLNIKINSSLDNLKKELTHQQKLNETAKYQIIGLTLETRPDYIDEAELQQMRDFGCTRVELGVQAIDDQILKLNKRGSTVADIASATKLLKDWGFKVTYHIMPALPGSTPAKDLEMFKDLFTEPFQPDQIKFYPTVVTKGSLLYRWWKQGKYQPYTDLELQNLIIDCKKNVPEYVRIIRLIRDIPKESIIAGNIITNLRQLIQQSGAVCHCIRCREVKDNNTPIKNSKLKIISYTASGGLEYFISYNSEDEKTLYGFCRLRLINNQAIIRELHVYGQLVSIGANKKTQHAGLGKKLMAQAELIAKQAGCQKISVISGVGVRNYYRKLDYKLSKTYMIKNLTPDPSPLKRRGG